MSLPVVWHKLVELQLICWNERSSSSKNTCCFKVPGVLTDVLAMSAIMLSFRYSLFLADDVCGRLRRTTKSSDYEMLQVRIVDDKDIVSSPFQCVCLGSTPCTVDCGWARRTRGVWSQLHKLPWLQWLLPYIWHAIHSVWGTCWRCAPVFYIFIIHISEGSGKNLPEFWPIKCCLEALKINVSTIGNVRNEIPFIWNGPRTVENDSNLKTENRKNLWANQFD